MEKLVKSLFNLLSKLKETFLKEYVKYLGLSTTAYFIYSFKKITGRQPKSQEISDFLKHPNWNRFAENVDDELKKENLKHNYVVIKNRKKNNKKLNYHIKLNNKPKHVYLRARANL